MTKVHFRENFGRDGILIGGVLWLVKSLHVTRKTADMAAKRWRETHSNVRFRVVRTDLTASLHRWAVIQRPQFKGK